ncbi:protein kinase, partial [Phenylobacterium sp.]|uniref:protein kinase domain-containing protein n=1 Tax=Phenylobacterium sp. TaxID=1871053 RepID=UPI002737011F
VNQYVVLDDIGSGASGKVKLAFCVARKTPVAIKVIRRQSKAPAKVGNIALGRRATVLDSALRREIAIMKKLVHQNVVPLYEVIDDPSAEKLYLVMKYADCGAVAKLRPDGSCDTLPLRRVVDVAIQVCSGLRYLHECGVVHRDIKPDNLLATSDRRVMIADFGVSQLADSVLNGPEAAMEGAEYGGTPLFMAPELHGGYFNRSVWLSQNPVVDDASIGSGDMWALGTTLFCLLWGRLQSSLCTTYQAC